MRGGRDASFLATVGTIMVDLTVAEPVGYYTTITFARDSDSFTRLTGLPLDGMSAFAFSIPPLLQRQYVSLFLGSILNRRAHSHGVNIRGIAASFQTNVKDSPCRCLCAQKHTFPPLALDLEVSQQYNVATLQLGQCCLVRSEDLRGGC